MTKVGLPLFVYDVGNKSCHNRNDKQKVQNEIAERLSTSAFSLTKLGQKLGLDHNQL
jgi:hypothetical protein